MSHMNQDEIWLQCDYDKLSKTRELQSERVKHITQFDNYADAICAGNLDNMKWLKTKNCPWNLVPSYCSYNLNDLDDKLYCISGNTRYLWSLDQKSSYINKLPKNDNDTYLFSLAITFGDIKIIKWLLEANCPCDEDTFATAAKLGNFKILKLLHQAGCPWDERTFAHTAKHGDPETIKWLLEARCPFDEWTFTVVVAYCNTDVVKYLLENGCSWDKRTFTIAAKYNKLEVMNLLLDVNSCPWDIYTFYEAVTTCNLDTAKFLYDLGCPLNSWPGMLEIYSSDKEVDEWLKHANITYMDCIIN